MKFIFTLAAICISICTATFATPLADSTVSTLVNVHQGNGAGLATRTVIDTFLLPHDLSGYASIEMHVLLNCPTGGCDPWDRFASIRVWHDNEWYEIGRYMTPYGKSCGWTIDVSDYRSLLKDTVIINSFIDTWTNPGWLVNIDFKFIAGIPVNPFIKIENLWNDYNVVYGDSTQPLNVPTINKVIDGAATGVKIKLVNTGHGQGNTDNAAEFSQKTHHINVNGIQAYSQWLWRTNCASNPCSPQAGTWQYSRAGWCPGADVIPAEYDIMAMVTPGISVALDYELQSYFNNCSPHNPACINGSTCNDCNYNNNGHTEPHYKIASQLITYLSTPTGITKTHNSGISLFPNPSNGNIKISFQEFHDCTFEVYSLMGMLVYETALSRNGELHELSFLPKGIYIARVKSDYASWSERIIIE